MYNIILLLCCVYAKATRPNAARYSCRRTLRAAVGGHTATADDYCYYLKRLPDNKTQLLLLVRKLILGQ